MSNITKRAMAQSLKKMLLVKDIDKITITDITNDCGINRQTFYYHLKTFMTYWNGFLQMK